MIIQSTLPFLLMSFIIYKNTVTELRKEIEQSNINKLEQVVDMTNNRLEELENIAAMISFDLRLTPYMMEDDYYRKQAIQELKKYRSNSSIIEDIFVYYPDVDNELLYSSSGIYSLGTLINQKYQFKDLTKVNLKSHLQTTVPKVISKSYYGDKKKTRNNMIILFYPISLNNPHPYGTVMYFINESMLTNLTHNMLGNIQGDTFIFDGNNQIITMTERDYNITKDHLKNFSRQKNGTYKLDIDGKEFSVSVVKSMFNDWTFMTLMDANQFFERVFQKKAIILVFLFSLLLTGLMFAIILGKKQYKPIKNLTELMNRQKIHRNNQSFQKVNELESLQTTISNIFESYEDLNETFNLHKPYARDHLLIKLMKGDLPKNSNIRNLLNSLHINLYAGGYFVVAVFLKENENNLEEMEEREKLIEHLSGVFTKNATVNGIDLFYEDAILLLVSVNHQIKDIERYRKEMVVQIKKQINKYMNVSPTLGVGCLTHSIENINRSYIEAIATMDYIYSLPQGNIVYFEEINTKLEDNLGYPQEDLLKLVHSLKQGNQVVATETLNIMFSRLIEQNLPLYKLKCICFDIINTLVKTASELNMIEYVSDLKEITSFSSLEQLENHLKFSAKTICQKVEEKKESHQEQLREKIKTYIHNNFNQYELSLESIADAFQLSIPYVSKFIKEQFGYSFTQYVFELRVNEVKKQLVETDKLIKEIVLDVGYRDVSNFTRAFKKKGRSYS